jgi:uncharacterized protein
MNPRSGIMPTTLVGLCLTLGVGSLPIPVWDHEFVDVPHLIVNELLYWGLVAVVLLYVRSVERRSWNSIGFRRPSAAGILVGVTTSVVILVGLWALYTYALPLLHSNEDEPMARLLDTPLWWRVASVIRAGASEEILFRGYPIERLQEWTHQRWISIGVPWGVFALAHVGPWGWGHLLIAGFGGAMLTLVYVWRRNLWVNMLCHCLIDGAAVLS